MIINGFALKNSLYYYQDYTQLAPKMCIIIFLQGNQVSVKKYIFSNELL